MRELNQTIDLGLRRMPEMARIHLALFVAQGQKQ
jgi:hypothetical protein